MRQELAITPSDLPEYRRLRIAVVAAGVKQYAVADRLGISESHLSGLLSGRKTLDGQTAARIREAIKALTA